MVITNKTIGWAIIIIVWLFSTYGVYEYWAVEYKIGSSGCLLKLVFFHTISIVGLIVLIVQLLDGAIEFEFEIPNPFSQAIKMYREKKEAAQAIEGIYMKIAKAERNEEIDMLLKKLDVIKGNQNGRKKA